MQSGYAFRDSVPGGEAGVQSEADAMLLDRYLSQYDVTETHAIVVDADTDLAWQAVRRSDLSRFAVIRALLEMRSLPDRLQRVLKRQPPAPARPPLALDDMERAGFLLLGEWPGHEIVFGAVVQPWKAVTGDEPAPQVEPGRFAAFDTPGYVKVAFNIRVEPYGSGRALITTETRTAATDPASLRRFARYWALIGPFSALIRRLALRIVKSEAERRLASRAPVHLTPEPGGSPGADQVTRHADCLVLGAACQQLDRPDGLMALRDGRGVERGAVDQVDAMVDVSKAGVEQSGLFRCGSGERVVAGPGPCRGDVAVCCLPEIGAGAAG